MRSAGEDPGSEKLSHVLKAVMSPSAPFLRAGQALLGAAAVNGVLRSAGLPDSCPTGPSAIGGSRLAPEVADGGWVTSLCGAWVAGSVRRGVSPPWSSSGTPESDLGGCVCHRF